MMTNSPNIDFYNFVFKIVKEYASGQFTKRNVYDPICIFE